MTIADLIEALKQFPQDTLVLKYRDHGNGAYHWDTMDGHWFQLVDVVPEESGGVYAYGRYHKARSNEDGAIEALEL